MPDAEWKDLVRQTKTRPFNFEPYVMFTEPPYQSRYINVSQQGFRLVPGQGPWPMDPKNYNVLAFGGSTMFGYGVADDQTIAAYMQTLMQTAGGRRVCVYNFGRRAYFSTLERILLEQLLQNGAKPNLAIFLDGLNDFEAPDPSFLPQSRHESLTPPSSGARILELFQSLPAVKLAKSIMPTSADGQTAPGPDWSIADPTVINQYVWNIKAIESIGKSTGIKTIFAFQPTPTYEYDLTYHELKIKDWSLYGDQLVIHGYPLMAKYVRNNDMGDDFLWLADIQQGVSKTLYVDKWHYSPDFSRTIAKDICQFIEKRNLMPVSSPAGD